MRWSVVARGSFLEHIDQFQRCPLSWWSKSWLCFIGTVSIFQKNSLIAQIYYDGTGKKVSWIESPDSLIIWQQKVPLIQSEFWINFEPRLRLSWFPLDLSNCSIESGVFFLANFFKSLDSRRLFFFFFQVLPPEMWAGANSTHKISDKELTNIK